MSNLLQLIINILLTIVYTLIHLTIGLFELIRWNIIDPMINQTPHIPSDQTPKLDPIDTNIPIPQQHIQLLLQLHNIERDKIGANPLKLNTILCTPAQNHATWMNQNNKMSHTGQNRSSVANRTTQAGYRSKMVGENIAYGYASPQAVMNGWLKSSGHRANILRKQYKEIGIGISGTYWCVVFATPIIMTQKLESMGYDKYLAHQFIPKPISNQE